MTRTPQELFEQIPRIDAIPAPGPAATGLAYWRTAWSVRHTVAAVLAAPVLWFTYANLAGPGVPLGLSVAITLTSLVGAVVLASFVPPRGSDLASSLSGCGAGALLGLFAAGALLQDAVASPTFGWLALGISGIALAQRTFTAAAC